MPALPKLIIILGTTASGKTSLGIKLAQKFNGEVISADSRQIYKEFNIGTAKPEGRWMQWQGERAFIVNSIPHYLIDMIDPKEEFTLQDYKDSAIEKINAITQKNKLPFLVGGTALYLKAICENWQIPKVKPNIVLRNRLERKSAEELFKELQKKDPDATLLTGLNKRRIIRALEVIYSTNEPFSKQRHRGKPLFNCLKIGRKIEKEDLNSIIQKRVQEMLKNGLLAEVKKLSQKYPWSLVAMQSIDYQEFKDYFEGRETLDKTLKNIEQHHIAFAKRQMTWFKKDKSIRWIQSDAEAVQLVGDFLNSKN